MPKQIDSYWEVLEPFFFAIDIDNPEMYATSSGKVPHAIVLLYATHFSLSEIRNGGLLQFFWNSTGIVAPEAIEGFLVMRMPKLASFLEQAAVSLGDPYPRDRESRWNALLRASNYSLEDLNFSDQKKRYRAFVEATRSFGFDSLNKQIWEAADDENGGFDEQATAYAREIAIQ